MAWIGLIVVCLPSVLIAAAPALPSLVVSRSLSGATLAAVFAVLLVGAVARQIAHWLNDKGDGLPILAMAIASLMTLGTYEVFPGRTLSFLLVRMCTVLAMVGVVVAALDFLLRLIDRVFPVFDDQMIASVRLYILVILFASGGASLIQHLVYV